MTGWPRGRAARPRASLRGLDENRDGKVTAADVLWNTLRVWQDADSDGVTDDGQLKLLGELGITEFSLAN